MAMEMEDRVYQVFESIVGPENISVDPGVMDSYAFQFLGQFFGEIGTPWVERPEAVVLPGSTEEVQKVVRACNEYGLKFIAHSTGWGAWGTTGQEGVILLDLRRMNRIIEINEKDMYMVVEPYVCWAQFQAEAMKRGLNCAVIAAGAATSPLANCTAVWGVAHANMSMGRNERNVLGVEWVLPDGEILRLGSPGSGSGWISGDGPGPSLRGIMRGVFGTLGGLGVFTRAALRLYQWGGPPEIPVEKTHLLESRIVKPLEKMESVKFFVLGWPDYEDLSKACYKIGESEVAYAALHVGRGILGLLWGLAKESVIIRPLLPLLPKALLIINLVANSRKELEYQEKVLEKIADETGGILIDVERIKGALTLLVLKLGNFPGIMHSQAGAFSPAMTGNHLTLGPWARAATISNNAIINQEKEHKGAVPDTYGGANWGPIADHGHEAYEENEQTFDPYDPESRGVSLSVMEESTKALAEENISSPFWSAAQVALFKGLDPWDEVSKPLDCDPRIWMKKIKQKFDPNGSSHSKMYMQPEEEKRRE